MCLLFGAQELAVRRLALVVLALQLVCSVVVMVVLVALLHITGPIKCFNRHQDQNEIDLDTLE